MKPISSDRVWYMLWNLGLVTYTLIIGGIIIAFLMNWLGPKIVARGISLYRSKKE